MIFNNFNKYQKSFGKPWHYILGIVIILFLLFLTCVGSCSYQTEAFAIVEYPKGDLLPDQTNPDQNIQYDRKIQFNNDVGQLVQINIKDTQYEQETDPSGNLKPKINPITKQPVISVPPIIHAKRSTGEQLQNQVITRQMPLRDLNGNNVYDKNNNALQNTYYFLSDEMYNHIASDPVMSPKMTNKRNQPKPPMKTNTAPVSRNRSNAKT